MKHLILFFAMVFVLLAPPALHAREDYTPLDDAQLQQYYTKLDDQLDKAEDHLRDLYEEMADSSKMSPAARLDVDRAAEMLEVKMTLASNFVGTPSMRSAAVRDLLLHIMSQDSISESDLLNLQSLVASEKRKIAEFDRLKEASRVKEKPPVKA